MLRALWMVAALAALLGGRPLTADDYYVAYHGDDRNGNGSPQKPWRTLSHALRSLPPPTATNPHVIHVGPGMWHPRMGEQFPLYVPEGVTIRGAGIGRTVVSGWAPTSRRPQPGFGLILFRLQLSGAAANPGLPPPKLADVTLINARSAVEIVGTTTAVAVGTVRNCRFWNNQVAVVVTNAAPVVEDCLFAACSMGLSVGRIVTSGPPTVIRRNAFLRNGYGLNAANARSLIVEANRFEGNGIGVLVGTVGLITTRPTFRNNVYLGNGQALVSTAVLGGRTLPLVVHESFYGNRTGIVSMDDTMFGGRSDPDIRNTIVWGSLDHDLRGVRRDEIRNANFRTRTGPAPLPRIGVNGLIAVEPRFRDPARGDLHLRSDSPCIDAGRNDYTPLARQDFEGEPRSTGYPDLGADEYNRFLRVALAGSRPGELRLALAAGRDAGLPYVLALSYGYDLRFGIPTAGRVIPLVPDRLFYLTVGTTGFVPGFCGRLNGAGEALVTLRLPSFLRVPGLRFYAAFVTLHAAAPDGIRSVSNGVRVDPEKL